MDRLKPIETAYRGYRFRSRLEARWAVAHVWVEIKPEGYQPTSREHQMYQTLADASESHGFYLLRGINPGYRLYRRNQPPIESPKSFVGPEALRAGRSARFEHGARAGSRR